MPLKREGDKRWVEMQVPMPGTPGQVWAAMATGPGNAAWFTKGEIEPKVGGKLIWDFGAAGKSTGDVTAWEPPVRFAYVERDWAPSAPPVATEITITARSGGRCAVRMVHSLVSTSDEWDDQLESFEAGWPGFFEVLRIYLTYFAGMAAASFIAGTEVADEPRIAWARLLGRIGLEGANVGDHRTIGPGPESLESVVEHVYQDAKHRYVALRIDGPSPGVALVGTAARSEATNLSVCRFFYGEGSAKLAAAAQPAWGAWLSTAGG